MELSYRRRCNILGSGIFNMKYQVSSGLQNNPMVGYGHIRFNVLKNKVVPGLPEIPNEKNRKM